MSAPPPPDPPRKALHERSNSQNNRLGIRLVPYSPPRLSSDGSFITSRSASRADSDTLSPRLSQGRQSPVGSTPGPDCQASPEPDVSALRRATSPVSPARSPSLEPPADPRASGQSFSAPRRAKKVISINSDKTFSLVPQSLSASSRSDSARSPLSTLTTPRSSYGHYSSDTWTDERPSPPLTPRAEQSLSPESTPTPNAKQNPAVSTSAADYRLIGGLRKVENTPEPTDKQVSGSRSRFLTESSLQVFPVGVDDEQGPPSPLANKKSFQSSQSDSTTSDAPNYEIHAQSLPPLSNKPSFQSAQSSSSTSDKENYKIHEQSLPPLSNKPSFQSEESSSSTSDRENYKIHEQSLPPLSNKPSFQSAQSSSSSSGKENYKILAQSSPVIQPSTGAPESSTVDLNQLPPSSSHSNYQIHHASSFGSLVNERRRPPTGDSDANYVVHDGSSISLSPSRSKLRSEYSQESLVVAPLRPARQRSLEFVNLVKSRSRDSLRTGSLSSLSNIISQEATRALFAGPAVIQIPPRAYGESSRGTISAITSFQAPQMIASHPHQWSSQLSTVASESEGGSEPPSRSVSSLSGPGRRGSGVSSGHGRRHLSASSNLSGLEEVSPLSSPRPSQSHSRSGSLDTPPLAYHRRQSFRDQNGPPVRLVRDLDEDGDGLADLEALHHRPSRTRLNAAMSSGSWSASSSRANSFSSQTAPQGFPAWARLYYGSGERRLLAVPSSDSMFQQYNDSRPASAFIHHAPSLERLTPNLYNSRRRARDSSATPSRASFRRSMEIAASPILNLARGIKKQTSSVWSPHLHRDKRAKTYSIWEPPSSDWTDEKGGPSRRNYQFVLFVIGFVFPLAWILGALLPLPAEPSSKMSDMEVQSTGHMTADTDLSAPTHGVLEARHIRVKYWRSINRGMSIVGMLVIAAIVALSVVGVRQRW